jgi:catechol 2,3-dioxygenase-like lactoylglutathione lyase family enzyme
MTETARPALHHVAFACRDIDETHHFYADVLGLTLIHTEVTPWDQGFFRHAFYDLGDGSALAFFDLHDAGEPTPIRTAISEDLGLPLWVNHVALRVDEQRKVELVARLDAAGIEPLVEVDHDWCLSTYYQDPNGIMVELCLDTPGVPVEPERAMRDLHAVPEPAARAAGSEV